MSKIRVDFDFLVSNPGADRSRILQKHGIECGFCCKTSWLKDLDPASGLHDPNVNSVVRARHDINLVAQKSHIHIMNRFL